MELWAKKGYKFASETSIPECKSRHVALHMRDRIVVYDANMSEEELKGSSSGHLWDEGNYSAFEAPRSCSKPRKLG